MVLKMLQLLHFFSFFLFDFSNKIKIGIKRGFNNFPLPLLPLLICRDDLLCSSFFLSLSLLQLRWTIRRRILNIRRIFNNFRRGDWVNILKFETWTSSLEVSSPNLGLFRGVSMGFLDIILLGKKIGRKIECWCSWLVRKMGEKKVKVGW